MWTIEKLKKLVLKTIPGCPSWNHRTRFIMQLPKKISYSEVIKKYVFLSQLCFLLWCSISPCQWSHPLSVDGNLGFILDFTFSLAPPSLQEAQLLYFRLPLHLLLTPFLPQSLPHLKLSPALCGLSPGLLSQLSSVRGREFQNFRLNY